MPVTFPGNPVFPGVLQLEALAQAGAIAVLADERYAEAAAVRWRRRCAVPAHRATGDEIVLAVELERLSARGGWGRGVATVEGKECCRARLLFAFASA